QSSVPRRTVGHHARAATYEMGLQQPAKAAVERCRGGASTSPPQSGLGTLPLIYPPTNAQGRARAVGQRGGFLNPAKLICLGFAVCVRVCSGGVCVCACLGGVTDEDFELTVSQHCAGCVRG